MEHTSSETRLSAPVRSRWSSALDAAITAVVLAAAVIVIWTHLIAPHRASGNPRVSKRNDVVLIGNAPVRGNRLAQVAIIEYSDFQCPFCSQAAHQVLPTIEAEYIVSGKILFAFRHNPLSSLHPSAVAAATAAECARRQGKFWALHDRLFSRNGRLDSATIRQDAIASGVASPQWDVCMASGEATRSVEREAKTARAIGIPGTPTFLIGTLEAGGNVKVTTQIAGVGTTAEWRSALNAALARSHPH